MISRLTWHGALFLAACLVALAAQAQAPAARCAGRLRRRDRRGAPAREPTIKDYEQILKRQPRSARDYYDHGVLHERMGQHTSALLDYSQAIAQDPCLAQATSAAAPPTRAWASSSVR